MTMFVLKLNKASEQLLGSDRFANDNVCVETEKQGLKPFADGGFANDNVCVETRLSAVHSNTNNLFANDNVCVETNA